MQRLTFLAVALMALRAPADEVGRAYRQEVSWAASMTATRQQVVKLPLHEVEFSPWHVSDAQRAESLAGQLPAEESIRPGVRGPDDKPLLTADSRRWKDLWRIQLDGSAGTIRYLYRDVRTPAAIEFPIQVDYRGPLAVWLNGTVVFRRDQAPEKSGPASVPLALKAGANRLLIKVHSTEPTVKLGLRAPWMELNRRQFFDRLCRRFWDDFPEMDWLLQDQPGRTADGSFDARRDFGWYFQPKRDASAERAMIQRVLDEAGPQAGALAERLAKLVRAAPPVDDPSWLALYAEACAVRRTQRLSALAALAPRFVFTRHSVLGGSHYAYTEGQSDAQAERHFVAGAALCLAQYDGRQMQVETLLEDPNGVIRDPDVSFDGRRVLFAWKKSDRDDDYHLYEMDLDTRSVRQLTEGLAVADYEGAYLPGGDIVFNSTRCVQTVDCWWTEVSNLYRCDAQGGKLRRLTFDQVHDNFPTVTEDGRILYTRWEYNDRGQIYPQPLLQMNPDGTNQNEFYGVNSWFPTTILHARGMPGSQKALAIATGHHTRQTGKLIVIDPSRGRQEADGVQLVAPPRETPAVKVDRYGQEGDLFQYPYPLSAEACLVSYHPVGWEWTSAVGPRFGVYFMTLDGRRELLVADSKLPCGQPIPLRVRDGWRARPDLVDYRRSEGTCYVQDVYAGPGLEGLPRGIVKSLRVVSLDFRAAGIGSNGNSGPGGTALVSTPVAIGNGTWDPKIVLGDARVYDDGSTFFRLPARRPVYFQLLDAEGRMVQSMRSWTTIQPGENAACVGCHEHKNSTPLAKLPVTLAVRAGAQPLTRFGGEPQGFSFARQIQPILQRHCVQCHTGAAGKPCSLTDRSVEDTRAKRLWSEAYLTLTHAELDTVRGGYRGDADHALVNWISAQSAPPALPPYSAGSARSKLIEMLREGHEGVKLGAEDLATLCTWIDLGVPFCGDYREAQAWTDEERAKYEHYLSKRQKLDAAEVRGVAALAAPGEPARQSN